MSSVVSPDLRPCRARPQAAHTARSIRIYPSISSSGHSLESPKAIAYPACQTGGIHVHHRLRPMGCWMFTSHPHPGQAMASRGPSQRRQIRSACASIKQPRSGFRSPPGCPLGIVHFNPPGGPRVPTAKTDKATIINFESRSPVPLSLRRSASNSSACLASPALDLPGHIHVSPILGQ